LVREAVVGAHAAFVRGDAGVAFTLPRELAGVAEARLALADCLDAPLAGIAFIVHLAGLDRCRLARSDGCVPIDRADAVDIVGAQAGLFGAEVDRVHRGPGVRIGARELGIVRDTAVPEAQAMTELMGEDPANVPCLRRCVLRVRTPRERGVQEDHSARDLAPAIGMQRERDLGRRGNIGGETALAQSGAKRTTIGAWASVLSPA
jgi:hypothetical protein